MVFSVARENSVEVHVKSSGVGAFRSAFNTAIGALSNFRGALIAVASVLTGVFLGGLRESIAAAREWSGVIRELTKVTDPDAAERLGEAMTELGQTIPLATTELVNLATQAARFGIAEEHIDEFVETVAKMAFATDVSIEEAGQAFARLSTLTGLAVEDVDRLANAINILGQTTATSSGNIVDNMLRSAGSLTQLGLQADEIAGLAATINATSESADRAGTRLRRLAFELDDPSNVEDFSAALGMTSDEFVRMREDAPLALIVRMAEVMDRGGAEADALANVIDSRARQALIALGSDTEALRQNLENAGVEFEQMTSLNREFGIEAASTGSAIQRLQNSVFLLLRRIGDAFVPTLKGVVNWLNNVITALNDSTTPIGGVAAEIGFLAGELGQLIVLFLGFVESVLPKGTGALEALRTVLHGIATALAIINDTLERLMELWEQIPEPIRRGAFRAAAGSQTTLPITEPLRAAAPDEVGRATSSDFEARRARRLREHSRSFVKRREAAREAGFEGRVDPNAHITIQLQGDGELTQLIAEMAQARVDDERRTSDRLDGRPSGV